MQGFPAFLDGLEERWRHKHARLLRRSERAEKREERRRQTERQNCSSGVEEERQTWLQPRCRSAGLYLEGMSSVLRKVLDCQFFAVFLVAEDCDATPDEACYTVSTFR